MPSSDLLGPCGGSGGRGHHTADPDFECFFQRMTWYGPNQKKLKDAHKAQKLVKIY